MLCLLLHACHVCHALTMFITHLSTLDTALRPRALRLILRGARAVRVLSSGKGPFALQRKRLLTQVEKSIRLSPDVLALQISLAPDVCPPFCNVSLFRREPLSNLVLSLI